MTTSSYQGASAQILHSLGLIGSNFMKEKVRFLAYDELMSTEVLGDIGIVPSKSVTGFAKDCAIGVLAPTGESGIGMLSLVDQPDTKVYGVVHDITSFDLLLIDFVATARSLVRKSILIVDCNGYEEHAWTYVAKQQAAALKMHARVLSRITTIAEDVGLPSRYVAEMALLPRIEDQSARDEARNDLTDQQQACVSG